MSVSCELLSSALFLSSVQFSIGSVLLSSTYSVRNFSKDQDTLNNGCGALKEYETVAFIWMIIVALFLVYSHGLKGLIIGLIFNILVIGWIHWRYCIAFKDACKKHNLRHPNVWFGSKYRN